MLDDIKDKKETAKRFEEWKKSKNDTKKDAEAAAKQNELNKFKAEVSKIILDALGNPIVPPNISKQIKNNKEKKAIYDNHIANLKKPINAGNKAQAGTGTSKGTPNGSASSSSKGNTSTSNAANIAAIVTPNQLADISDAHNKANPTNKLYLKRKKVTTPISDKAKPFYNSVIILL